MTNEAAQRPTYHHGNLKAALIGSTLQLVLERGPMAFTMAEAARRSGVSSGAPYKHFTDTADLLAEISLIGFTIVTSRLETVVETADLRQHDALSELAVVWVEFAQEFPAHFAVMFASRMDKSGRDALQAMADRVSSALEDGISIGFPQRRDKAELAIQLGAIAHGVAMLVLDGRLAKRIPAGESATTFVTRIVENWAAGLRSA